MLDLSSFKDLDKRRVAIFVAILLEYQLPFYEQFQKDEKWGDFLAVESAVDRIWQFGLGLDQGIAVDLEAIRKAAPDSEDHGSPFTVSALQLCTIIESCSKNLGADDADWLLDVVESWESAFLTADFCVDKMHQTSRDSVAYGRLSRKIIANSLHQARMEDPRTLYEHFRRQRTL